MKLKENFDGIINEIKACNDIIGDSNEDKELKRMASEDIVILEDKLEELQ